MLVEGGKSFEQAIAQVRDTSYFHHAHAAFRRHRRFPFPLVENISAICTIQLGTNRDGTSAARRFPPATPMRDLT